MVWRVEIRDLGGSVRVSDLPWMGLSFTHVLNAPGSASIDVSMSNVSRADIEPGRSDYRIYQGSTLRAAGRIWNAHVDTPLSDGSFKATLTGEGIAGIFARRLIDWEARYEPITESPTNINTVYAAATAQELIIWDTIQRTQAETGGDLGITLGSHTGGSHLRRRWYCAEDGVLLSELFDDFASLADGIDWAITPTLTNPANRTLVTFNPERGSDLSGSITLDGQTYLDTFSYEIDAGQIVSRGRSVGEGDCDPPIGDDTHTAALADYDLLEAFSDSQSDLQEDADETATGLHSPKPIVAADVTYELTKGPALGAFDVGDTVHQNSPRVGWELDMDVRVEEIEVSVQLPDDDDHTFVRVNWSEIGSGS